MASKKRKNTKGRKAAARKAGARMKKCGRKWRSKSDKFRKTHKWTAFIKKSC